MSTDDSINPNLTEKRHEALAVMRSALALIDEAGGPLDVGAHLDLAICRMEAALSEAPDT